MLAQRRRGITRAVVFLGVGWCLAALLLVRAAAALAPIYSGVALYRALPQIPPDAPIYSVATYDQSLPFYWQRTLKLVAYRGELDFGLGRDPAAEEPDIDRFIDRWQTRSGRLCGHGPEDLCHARRAAPADARAWARYQSGAGVAPLTVREFHMQPFLPFTRPSIDEQSIAAVADVFRSGQLASGPKVQAFEAALAAYLGADRHVRVMTSATAGLEMALEVAGIGAGDEVIVPAMSFAASANVVARVRAKPVFVDIELKSRNLNVDLIERAITPRTRAIMPVHFSGLPVDSDRLYEIAGKHGLRVVEDAAHAIGSSYRGRRIGSFGDLVVFSFHPNKNMTCIEGGAIATADAEAAALFEQYRFHGIKRNPQGEIDVMFPGAKSNLSDVAAQIGIDQLRPSRGLQRAPARTRRTVLRRARRLPRRRAAGARRCGP